MIDLDTKEKELKDAFTKKQGEMESHERRARECAEEMMRLQGEYRLVQEMKATTLSETSSETQPG